MSAPRSPAIQPEALHGSWLLEEWRIDYPGGRESSWPFGRDAAGLLTYQPDGWMSATMCWRQRSPLSAASALQANDASKARSYQEYLSYCGRWSLQGKTIAHEVQLSLNPALIGTRQLRQARINGGTLLLGVKESGPDGATREHQILWRRPDALP